MNRRETLAALAAIAASGSPRLALAQTTRTLPRLGVLEGGKTRTLEQWKQSRFAAQLAELGWTEGKTLAVELSYADGFMDRLPQMAAALVSKRVDLICAFGPEAAIYAARATRSIPIVFWGVAFPVEQELVNSYARPGRNVTGVAWNAGASMYGKLFEIIRQLSSSVSRVAYFTFPNVLSKVGGGQSDALDRAMDASASSLGMTVRSYTVSKQDDFEIAFKEILAFRAQALITATTWLSFLHLRQILDFVSNHRLIGVYDTKQFVDMGGLISYGPDNFYLRERTAVYADRILRGANPANIPVELPTKFELAINMQTARTLGIKVPQSILLRADRVIE